MEHFDNLANVHLTRSAILTIGVFDGVHRGHQALISHLVSEARAADSLAVVLTLFPHPDRVLHNLTGRYYLTTEVEKAHILGTLGVDVVVTQPFDQQVRQIRAAEFVDQLRSHLQMKCLWITADFAMGYKREGNFDFLRAQGIEKGFEVREIELVKKDQDHSVVISSSGIREALTNGNVEQAAEWLGRAYTIEGQVVHGDHRGRTIGFPTANIATWEEQIIPADGVYACWATLNDERFMAVTNIGMRPTFNGTDLRVEAYLLDFDRDIYGQSLRLDFVTRLRGEQKFSGLEALIAQIRSDAQQGREILAKQTGQPISGLTR